MPAACANWCLKSWASKANFDPVNREPRFPFPLRGGEPGFFAVLEEPYDRCSGALEQGKHGEYRFRVPVGVASWILPRVHELGPDDRWQAIGVPDGGEQSSVNRMVVV